MNEIGVFFFHFSMVSSPWTKPPVQDISYPNHNIASSNLLQFDAPQNSETRRVSQIDVAQRWRVKIPEEIAFKITASCIPCHIFILKIWSCSMFKTLYLFIIVLEIEPLLADRLSVSQLYILGTWKELLCPNCVSYRQIGISSWL